MNKSSRNLGAVLAVLVLLFLIAGLVFVVVTVYKDPLQAEIASQESSAMESTTQTSETEPVYVAPKRIALFETADINGYLMNTTSGDPETFEYRLAYVAKVVENAREAEDFDDVILIDGGDIYAGTPVSDYTGGAALRAAVGLMGYDAVSLGHSDFAKDISEYTADTFCTVPAYEFGDYTGDPEVPVICADICYSNNHSRTLFTKDYVIVEKAGCRIALIGYIPDFSDEILAENFQDYEIHADLEEFSSRIKDIKEGEKPDATIVVTHSDPAELAAALGEGEVDLVAGAGANNGIYGVADNGIAYVEGGEKASGYASATLVIASDGTVTIENPKYTSIIDTPERLYDTSANAGMFDADVLKLSHDSWDAISEQMNEALGYTDVNIEHDGFVDDRSTTGGNFVTGLMLSYTMEDGVDAAFTYSGGICTDFEVEDGGINEISVGDIYALAPYNDYWLIYDVSGQELVQLLIDGFTNPEYGDQVSGLTFEYNNNGTVENPDIEIVSITLKSGSKVDLTGTDETYRIVISSHCAYLPGSIFEDKEPVHSELEAPVDNQAIISILRDRRDRGDIHISVNTDSRCTCLNADSVPSENAAPATTTETTEPSETTETTETETAGTDETTETTETTAD